MSHPELSSILILKRGIPRDLPLACLNPAPNSLPMDMVNVLAGFPSPAADYEEQRLDLHQYWKPGTSVAAAQKKSGARLRFV